MQASRTFVERVLDFVKRNPARSISVVAMFFAWSALSVALAAGLSKRQVNEATEPLGQRLARLVMQAEELQKSLYTMRQDMLITRNGLDDAVKMIGDTKIVALDAKVTKLSQEIEDRVAKTVSQVEALNAMIDPRNSGEIMTIARMNEELHDRQGYEAKIDKQVTEVGRRIELMQSGMDGLHNWIWGVLLTVMAGLFGTVIYLLRIVLKSRAPVLVPNA